MPRAEFTAPGALQAIELMLRPGEGQCTEVNVAHAVLVGFMRQLEIEPIPEL